MCVVLGSDGVMHVSTCDTKHASASSIFGLRLLLPPCSLFSLVVFFLFIKSKEPICVVYFHIRFFASPHLFRLKPSSIASPSLSASLSPSFFLSSQDPLERLQLMAVLVDSVGIGSLRGGNLASGLHTHLKHGDPLVKALVSKTLRRVCAPLTDMVYTEI